MDQCKSERLVDSRIINLDLNIFILNPDINIGRASLHIEDSVPINIYEPNIANHLARTLRDRESTLLDVSRNYTV